MASIHKRPDGRWRARYRDDAGKEHARHFDRKVDGQGWLDEVTAAVVTGAYVDPARGKLTVGAWATSWLAGRVHLKPKTVAGYESLLASQIRPRWENVPLARVSHAEVVAWVAAMRDKGLSASRTRQAYHVLTSMLDDAVSDGRLARNPAAGIDLPRMTVPEKRYLTHSQVRALAAACKEHEALVLTLAYTGIRWGEAVALKVRRADLLRGRLQIVEAATEVGGHLILGTPKSHQNRSVPVPGFLRDTLAKHIAGRGPDELVFRTPRGALLRSANFRRDYFNPAAESIGLEGLVPHELRHTAASLAISAGASIKGVQEMLGHASATLTLDRYGHLYDDELDAVADRLDKAAKRDLADSPRTKRVVTPIRKRATGG
jgi:integrase